MTAPYRLGIAQFVEHFRAQAQAISEVKLEMHRKLLYCSALDPLASAVSGRRGTHRQRLTHLLTNHSGWDDASRVSLFQLSCHLRDQRRTRFRLYREVTRRLSLNPPRRRQRLGTSPHVTELQPFASPEDGSIINLYNYGNLFYTYRNNLVHEYREPGYGTDWSRAEDEPFYTNLSAFGTRELVFPLSFIAKLYDRTLINVEAHLLRTKTNPHTRFQYGSHWQS